MMKYITFKRFLDIIMSVLVLAMLSPFFIVIFICLLFYNKGKPFFFQERPGMNKKIFKIIKFKTMSDKKDANGKLLPDEQRMTLFGSFLRKASLDEIPQLINVLIGDMSIIGPRPLRVHYLPYYTKEEAIRHTVKPGITGLAQISGRNLLSWDDRLAKDIEYVKTMSFSIDIVIFFKTIKKVIISSNIDLDPNMLPLDELRKQH